MKMQREWFDKVVEDSYGEWSQICVGHASEFEAVTDSNDAIGTCGVKGCSNDAEYYVTVTDKSDIPVSV